MHAREAVQTKRIDPLLCDLDLTLSGTFYPAGFPLHIATNSPHVLQAAEESWAPFHRAFDTPAMEFRVVVEPGGDIAAAPTFRKQRHLLSFVSDAHNFATADTLHSLGEFPPLRGHRGRSRAAALVLPRSHGLHAADAALRGLAARRHAWPLTAPAS